MIISTIPIPPNVPLGATLKTTAKPVVESNLLMPVFPFKSFRTLGQMFGPFRREAIFLFVIILAAALFETMGIGMVLPLLQTAMQPQAGEMFGLNLGHFAAGKWHLLLVCTVTLILIGLRSVFILLRYFYSTRFINRLRCYWSTAILENYLFAKYAVLIKHQPGVLLNNMVHEPTYASKALRDLIDLFANVLIALGITILLFSVNWRITVGVGLFSGVVLFGLWRITYRFSTDIGRKKIRLNQLITQVATEAINGIRQLKIFSLEKRVKDEFASRLMGLVQIIVSFRVVSSLPVVLGELVIVVIIVGILLVYHYGLKADMAKLIPVLGLFMVCAVRFFTNISRLLTQRMSIASYWPSLNLVRELADKNPLRPRAGACFNDRLSERGRPGRDVWTDARPEPRGPFLSRSRPGPGDYHRERPGRHGVRQPREDRYRRRAAGHLEPDPTGAALQT